ncbi:hypothetical protein SAICODRAFT_32082 [Saitoella complicata NRRL Y-17804]|uniref:uncharacterized protein n=1 Tax=Saitoella complicata (strain BCRC 22490 / CBS 7301 / JCM 7358 / NBRC 10748 / NRRL Y-17804) TaxID=698492 RepID=UPI0008670255|nr:uncharacterized protein SAICODRAFT_32082 [Saitoella complicata NRRL Y-17804]ODQ50100.1 hypothetical protein SAICODRAFT_32082 [Saitoella complicata NRRL Y-17804]
MAPQSSTALTMAAGRSITPEDGTSKHMHICNAHHGEKFPVAGVVPFEPFFSSCVCEGGLCAVC